MKVILVGASGMVGMAVLQECLANLEVDRVLALGRTSCGVTHPKFSEVLLPRLEELTSAAESLKGYDACFYTLGVTSVGMSEADYTRLTYDLTKSVAETLLRLNPAMAMVFVSGRSSDSTESGPVMWARVKGKAENLLLQMPFKSVTIVRLAGLAPAQGFRSRYALYNLFLPLMPLLARAMPGYVTTPRILGRAFIRAAQGRAPKPILESPDIHALGN